MTVDVAGAAAALQGADDILILSHRRPDGDTAGCAGALCRALRQIGKTAYILENPEITKRYMPLIVPCYPPEGFQPQFVVSTDIAEEKLFPDTAEPYKGKVDLVIDHHRSNLGFGKQNLVRPDAGACAEVLYDVIMALGVKLTTDIAECVYIGVSTDTGCFKFSNTTAHTHAVAAACLTAGIDGARSTAPCSRPKPCRASRWSASSSTRWSSMKTAPLRWRCYGAQTLTARARIWMIWTRSRRSRARSRACRSALR